MQNIVIIRFSAIARSVMISALTYQQGLNRMWTVSVL